jgi:aspartate kinase
MNAWFPSSADPQSRPIRVLKFGGTSVGDAAPLQKAGTIVRAARAQCRPVVVVSAAAGITDDLVRAANDTRADRATAEAWARDVGRRYRTLAQNALGSAAAEAEYEAVLRAELSELRRALQSARSTTGADRDTVLATGERLMAPLFAAVLTAADCPARPVDASALLRTDATHGDATVQWDDTKAQMQEWRSTLLAEDAWTVPVLTGFIGGTANGTTTTIGRGGSDLSAAVVARALDADRLERWTDVDGLYTRDPATHDNARPLDQLDFDQARTWTKAGRLGMHPSTLEPLASANIPVHVRCTHRPEADGTRIVPPVPAR